MRGEEGKTGGVFSGGFATPARIQEKAAHSNPVVRAHSGAHLNEALVEHSLVPTPPGDVDRHRHRAARSAYKPAFLLGRGNAFETQEQPAGPIGTM